MSLEDHDQDLTRSHVYLAKDTIIGHYRIVEKIGAGGMGEVYLAEDTQLNRKVALKFLPLHLCQDYECRARFTREAQAAAKLDHPNIVAVHEVSEFQGRPFFSMQHVEGQSLKEVLSGKTLPLDRILEIGIQVCDGLQAAHESGITHRDIKPSNILIDSHGRARIVDFGLASVMGLDHLTKTGSTLGTIGYMSPEQVRGDKVDHRTDLFSFGVVLYEMITGHAPFKADSEAATLHAITDTKPEFLARFRRDVPADLQTIIDKALDKSVATRYQHADDLSADLKRLISRVGSAPSVRKGRFRVVVPSLVIIGLIVAALVLKPWRFEVSSTQESQAATNWLAVMYFDNIADPADSKRLGEIATNLLITGLSQSEYIRVMSSQRLYDLLKQMGKEGVKTIDRATASEIAKKAEAKWMLTGSILQSEPTIVLTSQLIDVSTGGVLASQRITGNQGENIFAVIDRLTEDVKKCGTLPAAIKSEPSVNVAEVTTHSQEAYKCYLEGIEYIDKFYFPEARESLLRAVTLDSTFASAYLQLAIAFVNSGARDTARWAIAKAEKYGQRASDRERRFIDIYSGIYYRFTDAKETDRKWRQYFQRYPDDKSSWDYYAWWYFKDFGGSSDSALLFMDRALALDPSYKLAYNELAYIYGSVGNFDKALAAVDRYIELAPNEASPFDSRGDLWAFWGQRDSAIASYSKAVSIKPDHILTTNKLGRMYLFAGEQASAESLYQATITFLRNPERGAARRWMVDVRCFQGLFREALRLADQCIAANTLDGMESANAGIFRVKAEIYDYLELRDAAAENARLSEEATASFAPADTVWQEASCVRWYCRAGDTARATALLERFRVTPWSAITTSLYWYARGELALEERDLPQAIAYLNRADSAHFVGAVYWPPGGYRLAQAYLESGDGRSAAETLEKLLENYYKLWNSPAHMYATAHYLLGRAYEATGDKAKAQSYYERFLVIWKNADPGLKDVEDAKARLARLKPRS